MRKKELEIRLQGLEGFTDPDPSLEQYPTHSTIASDILFSAYAEGDVADRTVADLGCGTGIFAIGACLLGAREVRGYDISPSAAEAAMRNADALGCDISFEVCDVRDVCWRCDTVFMNPPFGSQRRHADRPFLDKAMEMAGSVHSIHMETTLPFIKGYAESKGRAVAHYRTYKYEIPHTFSFHSRVRQSVDIVAVNIR